MRVKKEDWKQCPFKKESEEPYHCRYGKNCLEAISLIGLVHAAELNDCHVAGKWCDDSDNEDLIDQDHARREAMDNTSIKSVEAKA